MKGIAADHDRIWRERTEHSALSYWLLTNQDSGVSKRDEKLNLGSK